MNCRENLHFCEDSGVKNVLGFRYITSGKGDFSGEELRTVKGEGITGFVNSHLGTQISGVGGYNEQFGRVIPDPADQSLYEYIANGGALTDDVVHAAVRGNTGHIDTLASQAIENDPEAPVFYTEATQDEWDESVDEGYVQKSDIKTERAHEMPGTKNLIAQISRKLGGGTEGALHTTAPNRTAYFHYGQA